jgi:GR25 family glycosyltransferase involved in LPS biosynthesis
MIEVVYWINLERANKRRIHMEEIFQHSFFKDKMIERIEAYDGKEENVLDWFTIDGEPVELNKKDDFYTRIMRWSLLKNIGFVKRWREKRIEWYKSLSPIEKIGYCNGRLSKGEYACTLSHIETIRKFSESPYEIALIFEDDVTMEYEKYWKKSIEQVIRDAPEDWEILQLCYISNNHIFNDEYTLNENNVRFYDEGDDSQDAYSCAAYIINKDAANKIMDKIYTNEHYDLTHKYHHVADFLIYDLLRTYIYKYPYFIYRTKNDSYLHPDHLSGHVKSKKHITDAYESMNKIRKIENPSLINLMFCNKIQHIF